MQAYFGNLIMPGTLGEPIGGIKGLLTLNFFVILLTSMQSFQGEMSGRQLGWGKQTDKQTNEQTDKQT